MSLDQHTMIIQSNDLDANRWARASGVQVRGRSYQQRAAWNEGRAMGGDGSTAELPY
jgi:hypothetical protein